MKKRIFMLLFLLSSFLFINIVKAEEVEIINREEKRLLSDYQVIERTKEYYINPLYKDIMTIDTLRKPDETKLYANTNEYHTTIESAAKDLRTKMSNRNGNFTISIKTSDAYSKVVNDILEKALEHTGVPTEGDYLKWQYGGYEASIGGYSAGGYNYYDVNFTITYYTTLAEENKVTSEINKVINSLNLTGSNYEKLTKIYNYIIKNVTYDYDHLEDPNYTHQYTAYAALMNKTAVCQGYALLVYRMALESGIDARLIAGYGSAEKHGWNIVKLGKYYYNVDATWDSSYVSYGRTPFYLRNNANFQNHTRNTEYNTEEFNTLYPMSTYDYEEQPDKEEAKNGLVYNKTDKRWEIYKNDKIDTTFTGLQKIENVWYYFTKGIQNKTYNGVAKNEFGTWYVDNGVITRTHNEVVQYNYKWYAFVNSKLDLTYTGLSTNKSGTWYAEKGIVSLKYNGTYKDKNGKIYVITNSAVDTKFTGLKKVNNIWYYFKNGVSDFTYNGVATNEFGIWYVDKGIITRTHNEVIQYKNKWYAVVNSKLDLTYTGLSTNKNGTWYAEKGIVSLKYNGTYKDKNGNVYIIKNSGVDTKFTGLQKVNNTWYYFKNGVSDFTYNGVATNEFGTWYVDNGIITRTHNEVVYYKNKWYTFVNSKLDLTYTGLSTNKNGTWYAEKGIVSLKYNGTYKDATGKIYTIKNSKVI